jgi:hypothetical protein
MTLRAWITTLRGRVREALCPELAELRARLAALRGDYREIVAQRDDWMERALRAEDDRSKFSWQVRDTCARAERAEAKLADLRGDLKTVADVLQDFEGDRVYEQAQKAIAELDRLKARDADWTEKAKVWLASPEAAQRLAGYRELGARCAMLEGKLESQTVTLPSGETIPVHHGISAIADALQWWLDWEKQPSPLDTWGVHPPVMPVRGVLKNWIAVLRAAAETTR